MDYDILIIGSGPAGQHAAWQAAHMGKKAAIIERKSSIGGAGLQTGTIPSKALREAAYLASRTSQGMHTASHTARYGVMADVVRRKDMVIAQQESVILKRLLKSGVALIPGEASFVDEHTMKVTNTNGESRMLSASVILLATGSRPRRPSDIPFDKQTVLDSTSILKLKKLPKSLLVVGGGVIACEFVSIFAALGVEVSIVDSHEQLLAYLSDDVVGVLADSFENMGVQLLMQEKVVAIRKNEGEEVLTLLESGKRIRSEAVLYAQGRKANSLSLDTAKVGIELDHGWITVNNHFQSSQPHIYAVGDLIGRPALASTGMEQGRTAVAHAFGETSQAMPANLPMAIYAIPEISWVGKTEKEAKHDQLQYVVGRGYYNESARGQIIGDANGLVKLIVDIHTHKLIGVHIVGEHASELIHTGQLLMHFNGTVQDLVANVFNYPTLAECYKLAALDCMNKLP
ncbi:Si-specific NAD(P)(+) transhydrogenase [Mariprofundus sp. EBB-1]|uniref:Si-specific NAD(P)(+) transhydrogenase n=1 Tax=Mariprofundus sp. EBB-1 TaxID=2650971 RepID=UPI000EF27557|nr:Si-specific NAD(P)(+) transhydrogenase [Mariprofundus sp. EBB-1]RLL50527.1 Si-specific NAD(P)(+) transhydrogenase [Mariprofundus sp. EBB-1]